MKHILILLLSFFTAFSSNAQIYAEKATYGPYSFQRVDSSYKSLFYGSEYIFTGKAGHWVLPAISTDVKTDWNKIVVKNAGTEILRVVTSDGSSKIKGFTTARSNYAVRPGEAVTFTPDGTFWNVTNRFTIAEQRKNLVIYAYGQSNLGTDPSHGPMDSTYCPSHWKRSYSNVFVTSVNNSVLSIAPYTPQSGMGWIDQFVAVMSQSYWDGNIYLVIRSVGGTTLANSGGGTYPRADFKNYVNLGRSYIFNMIDSTTCDQILLGDQCESDAANTNYATQYRANLRGWLDEIENETGIKVHAFLKRLSSNSRDFVERARVQAAQDSVRLLDPLRISLINTDSIEHKGMFAATGTYGNNDNSHYAVSAAKYVGNAFADSVLSYVGRSKFDRSKPMLNTAAINTAGTTLTLTYNEPLDSAVAPFLRNFTCGTKIFTTIAVNGRTVTLTPSVPFYSGVSYTISYSKNTYVKKYIQDFFGNEADAFSNLAITNNCNVTNPTTTSLYTSNFAAFGDVVTDQSNYWTGTGGTTATANQTAPDGTTACARLVLTAGNANRFTKWFNTSLVADSTYRITFKIYIPEDYAFIAGTSGSNSAYNLCKVLSAGSTSTLSFFQYKYGDRMVYYEYQFRNTSPTNDDFYFELSGQTASTVYIKDVTITKVNNQP